MTDKQTYILKKKHNTEDPLTPGTDGPPRFVICTAHMYGIIPKTKYNTLQVYRTLLMLTVLYSIYHTTSYPDTIIQYIIVYSIYPITMIQYIEYDTIHHIISGYLHLDLLQYNIY